MRLNGLDAYGSDCLDIGVKSHVSVTINKVCSETCLFT